ncbi:response regulator [Deltaproteobacteria bacterium TL4]
MRILVADDETLLCKAIHQGLIRKGHEVQTAENGQQAWDLFSEQQSHWDVIITDIKMPVLDGLQLLKKIRQEDYEIPVIVITGHGDLGASAEALRLNAFDFVLKPFRLEQIYSILNKLESIQGTQKSYSETIAVMHGEMRLTVPSKTLHINNLVTYFKKLIKPFCHVHSIDLNKLSLCLRESFSNAIIHGNLNVSSSIRENDLESFYRMINEREQQPEYAERNMAVLVMISPEKLIIEVQDEGKGFKHSELPDPNDPETLLSSGRGILIIRAFMDEVVWNEKGNCVKMVKLTTPPQFDE